MIKIDGVEIKTGHYPDNTLLVKAPSLRGTDGSINFTWYYENDAELFTLICLKKHFAYKKHSYLWMLYCPHARMDRVKDESDVFTLKYFAEVINSLNFTQVNIYDPHSSVCTALINNVRALEPTPFINQTLFELNSNSDDFMVFYPDEGAMKRYSGMFKIPYAFGVKKRDWATGQILGLDAVGDVEEIKGKRVLIIDDICSKGGTFYHSAKKLRELGAKEVYLYITHCENTIFEGELLKTDLINKIYTTNSIFTKEHEKIEVFKL
jgi:ribose-phosphate pyrophosphokinase